MTARDISLMLDTLCPLHLRLSETGQILHSGPTLCKLRGPGGLVGQPFLKAFQIRRPRALSTWAALRRSAPAKLHLQLLGRPATRFKGVLVQAPNQGQLILNLSFGISVLDGVRDYALTAADFAATDLTIEMLYLVEAKTAAMESSRRLTEKLQSAQATAVEQAMTDTLTGLGNRRACDMVMARMIDGQRPFALMHIDLDFFKTVNDTLGHAAGDLVLKQAAQVMQEETRANDVVARVGGDEFVILLDGLADRETLAGVGARIIKRLQQPVIFDGQPCRISGSIGTTLSQFYGNPDPARMMADADTALYASKRAGRACQTFFAPDTPALFPASGAA